jgi:hypothetical protein
MSTFMGMAWIEGGFERAEAYGVVQLLVQLAQVKPG